MDLSLTCTPSSSASTNTDTAQYTSTGVDAERTEYSSSGTDMDLSLTCTPSSSASTNTDTAQYMSTGVDAERTEYSSSGTEMDLSLTCTPSSSAGTNTDVIAQFHVSTYTDVTTQESFTMVGSDLLHAHLVHALIGTEATLLHTSGTSTDVTSLTNTCTNTDVPEHVKAGSNTDNAVTTHSRTGLGFYLQNVNNAPAKSVPVTSNSMDLSFVAKSTHDESEMITMRAPCRFEAAVLEVEDSRDAEVVYFEPHDVNFKQSMDDFVTVNEDSSQVQDENQSDTLSQHSQHLPGSTDPISISRSRR
eukprot:gene35319-39954_t